MSSWSKRGSPYCDGFVSNLTTDAGDRGGPAPRTRGVPKETYLGDRRRKHNNFIQLSDPLHELIHARPLDNVHIVEVTLNLYRNGKVGLVEKLERGR